MLNNSLAQQKKHPKPDLSVMFHIVQGRPGCSFYYNFANYIGHPTSFHVLYL